MRTSDVQFRRLPTLAFAGLAATALLAAGCGSNADEAADTGGDATTTITSPGGVLNVLDASSLADGSTVTVKGFLFDDGGTIVISDLIAESFPPQPGGASMVVEGIVLDQFDGVAEEGTIRWRDEVATITATVQAGKLVDAEPVDS